MRTRSLARALAAAALLQGSALAAQPADTTKRSTEPLFTERDAVAAGIFVAATAAMFPIDRAVARRAQTDWAQENRDLRRGARALRYLGTPGSTYIGAGMYVVGRLGRVERMADLGLHGSEALIIARETVNIVKGLVGRARPLLDTDDPNDFVFGRGFRKGSDDHRSFPSGHSAMGFAAAAAVTAEASKWWPDKRWYIGGVMYGGAALIAASRIYNNKHWASDVTMGAAIGTFAGLKTVRYHHSHPGNRIDRLLLAARPGAAPDGQLALVWSFGPSSGHTHERDDR